MENNQCAIGNGKALGGDTAANDMLYTRGHPNDYDLWADKGLIGGPIHLENFQYSTSFAAHLLDAAHELGIKKIDYNGKDHLGFGIPQVTTKDGKRNSAAQSYLATAYRRKNLVIRPLSRAIKIIISPHTKDASGVKYLFEEELFIAKASKEVILSAGAINSAQLLLLSVHNHLQSLRITKETYDAVWQPLEGLEGFTIEVVLLHPKSKGYLKLQDGNPLHYPLINTNALSDIDDQDVDTILAGIQKALKLANTESLQKLGIHLNHHKVPGCDQTELSDEYWRCAIRHLSVSLRHVSGTARMGPGTDEDAVVDKDLMVYGIHKLRVADASVIPVTISGNLMAPEYMIGEQAADLIKNDWIGKKCPAS
ncbi:hypothetical protein NQ314_011807 [Rhamnusium bicolor]|uniref:Uncharacterized protein n=1 Tax=Rhamnusium bicolor TaxID=1586634 RepID=A0AAV8XFV0_9CUCU|nr:hypothetical protein NQ314_011807 [Rhamnusium bicolor]